MNFGIENKVGENQTEQKLRDFSELSNFFLGANLDILISKVILFYDSNNYFHNFIANYEIECM